MNDIPIEIESVFNSIKKRIGGFEVYDDAFDQDIVDAINSAFSTLHQLGIDDRDGNPIRVTNPSQTWNDFLDIDAYEFVKDFVYFKVRLTFDPPSSSSHLDAMQRQLDELTWRIEVEKDLEINRNV